MTLAALSLFAALALGAQAPAPVFSGLRTQGFAISPVGHLFPGDADLRLYREMVPAITEGQSRHAEDIYNEPLGRNPRIEFFHNLGYPVRPGQGQWRLDWLNPRSAVILHNAVERLERELHALLPDEEFSLGNSLARVANGAAIANSLHHDRGRHLAANYVIEDGAPDNPGTEIIAWAPSGFQLHRAPARTWAIVSGDQRELATGIPATIHAAPRRPLVNRLLIQVLFLPTNSRADAKREERWAEELKSAQAWRAGVR